MNLTIGLQSSWEVIDIKDIYFEENYGKLYEAIENGVCHIFKMETKDGKISNQFIKKIIPIKINGETFYDIVTPYGYGGPIIEYCNGSKEKLINDYCEKFSEYCAKNNIVSEFIRFHPLISNACDFNTIYNSSYIRNTLGTNLKDYDDPVQSEFSKGCRKDIRKILNIGITGRVIENPKDLSSFKEIYYSSMDRNEASDYYYFDDKYFQMILDFFPNNVVLTEAVYNDQVIAAGLYFIYNKKIHIHLSGTLTEYLNLSPAYILRHTITLWGKEKGYEIIHHGGGRSNSLDDSLYLFKKRFSKNTEFKFYIGKKIWNEKIYIKLCERTKTNLTDEFFPAYRKSR